MYFLSSVQEKPEAKAEIPGGKRAVSDENPDNVESENNLNFFERLQLNITFDFRHDGKCWALFVAKIAKSREEGDISLECEGKNIKAHSFILKERCD